jgi:hypothetical protein
VKRSFLWLGVIAVAAAVIFAVMHLRAPPEAPTVSGPSSVAGASRSPASSASAAAAARYPHAVRDQAKRDEMRARLLAAIAEANANAASAKNTLPGEGTGPGSAAPGESRGNRETNDLKEFGRFIQQAINEDFLPMARACAMELHARDPKARGSATIDFKLIGDKKIGGIVDSADVDASKSTLHDAKFETCIRESLYGVYFDPPPAGGEATLNFPITILEDGGVADDVDDFSQIRDRRNEK